MNDALFQDTTLLMDRCTLLRTYLDANPTLKDYVTDSGRFLPRATTFGKSV
jgi:hypothetical protein